MDACLFDKGQAEERTAAEDVAMQGKGVPRLRVPHRDQVEMHYLSLDELLPADHPARAVWQCASRLDLGRWLGEIKAVEGHVGRDATDPRLLLALWVQATLDGVAHARELARLCRHHLAYQWLCGGVSVNYHLLSDFRSQNADAWDDLLTQVVGSLLAADLVAMQRVAQDGMRVRASAGKASFRRRATLEECLKEARQQIEELKRLADESPAEATKRQIAARERAANERAERIEEALLECEALQRQREASAKKSGRKANEARASTTDPEARTMQFSDGGYRPGYNTQFATDTASGIIVGVDVTNAGTDNEQMAPMVEQLERRYGRPPEEIVVDGGFASLDAIEQVEPKCRVYAPLKEERKQLQAGKDPYSPKKGDSPEVAAWRRRMGTAAAKAIYGLRCQTAEWVNAICRNHGLQQMTLRGREKCRTIALLHAITHNLLVGEKLRAALAMAAG